jgi:hypothetical protein
MSASDFAPEKDIEILILQPWGDDEDRGASIEPVPQGQVPEGEVPEGPPPAARQP